MVKFIERDMSLLKNEILEMWDLVYKQFYRAGEAILTNDKNLAQQVIIAEKRVNTYELKIDSDVEEILARYNPVAIDLRFILALNKINTNLERIGDFANGIAQLVTKCNLSMLSETLIKEIQLKKMIEEVKRMLAKSKEAFENEDTALASSIFAYDKIIDDINCKANTILANYAKNNIESIEACLQFAGIFRKLERAGDHINNILEELIFYIDAKVVKHISLSKTKE
jgi:phosphate transport system protein